MQRQTIYNIYRTPPQEGAQLCVCGWVRTLRSSKNVAFIELNDGSAFKNLQIVLSDTLPNFGQVSKVGVGTAVCVRGGVVLTPGAKQPLEIHAEAIDIEGECAPDYPLQKKRHSPEFLRRMPHLRARTNTFSAAFRLRSTAAYALHKFFNENGFVYAHTPIITHSDAEGAGEMFRVTTLPATGAPALPSGGADFSKDFFGKGVNLTVSGQLEAESMALAFGKVYTFGPTFRAENSNTPRHAAEFWMIEPEIAFADIEDNMELAQQTVKYVTEYVLEHCGDEIEFFDKFYDKGLIQRLENLVTADFGRISYTEAIEILCKNSDAFEYKPQWGKDLQTEHERYLSEVVFQKPVFVVNYPKEIKSFYMRLNDDGKTVAAMDMLVPGVGELVGGSQREEREDVLRERMRETGISEQEYRWFLELRRFGGTKHAGFGLGFERLLMYLSGIANIRDVIPFPRTAGGI